METFLAYKCANYIYRIPSKTISNVTNVTLESIVTINATYLLRQKL